MSIKEKNQGIQKQLEGTVNTTTLCQAIEAFKKLIYKDNVPKITMDILPAMEKTMEIIKTRLSPSAANETCLKKFSKLSKRFQKIKEAKENAFKERSQKKEEVC